MKCRMTCKYLSFIYLSDVPEILVKSIEIYVLDDASDYHEAVAKADMNVAWLMNSGLLLLNRSEAKIALLRSTCGTE